MGQAPYQLARAPGSVAQHEAFLAPVAWCCCVRLVRQCRNGNMHQQRGQEAVYLFMPTVTSGVRVVLVASDLRGGKPYFTEQGRPAERLGQGKTPSPL